MSVSVSSGVTKALCRREDRQVRLQVEDVPAGGGGVVDRRVEGHTAQHPRVVGDERHDVTDRLLLQGQVGGDVPHRPALAQRRVVPLLRGKPLEQVGEVPLGR